MSGEESFTPRFSVVGLGKLGASMTAAIARRGFEVIGVDTNPDFVAAVNEGRSPIVEPGVAEAICANRARVRATQNCEEAVLGSDLTFVVVPTPSDPSGGFSLSYASVAFETIGRVLAKKAEYHVVVLSSTVLPGSMRRGLLPVIEQASGKKAGRDFGLCYSPEFIALGSVVHDFLNPDVFIIGESDERAGSYLARCYELVCENNAPCARTTYENAELVKLSINVFVTMKITFANLLGAICEQLPGADVDVVTRIVGSDKRIGLKYLKAGLGFGGPCFPRDGAALSYAARLLGCPMDFAETTTRLNCALPGRIIERLRRSLSGETAVALLGLAYKPGTPVIEESQSIDLARLLLKSGIKKLIVYDPLANSEARAVLDAGVEFAYSAQQCVADADVVVISTPDPAFASLRADDFKKLASNRVVVFDCWRILKSALASQPRIKYMALGIGIPSGENAAALESAYGRDFDLAASAGKK